MDYKKLQILSEKFTKELDLLKNNIIKSRQSKILGDFDGFLIPAEELHKHLVEQYNVGINDLFDGNMENREYIYNSGVEFFNENIETLKIFNNIFQQARERGDIKENKLKELIKKTLKEMSMTGGGAGGSGASFTPGEGMQYATPKAFKKKKKTNIYKK